MKAVFLLIVMVVIILAGSLLFFRNEVTAPSQTTIPEEQLEKNIEVFLPTPNQEVDVPIEVTGKARVFENTFSYVLRDINGNKVYEDFAMTDAREAGQFGNFSVKIPVPINTSRNLVVEVFEYSAKDGSVINLVQVPVVLKSQDRQNIMLFFDNNNLDPEISCDKVFPVEREIIRTSQAGFMTLFELLKGPTEEEISKGYLTSIPLRVKINSLRIENGTAYADFNERLEDNGGGSCHVTAVRTQIEETLKQFKPVNNVVISVNGRTEDILQP